MALGVASSTIDDWVRAGRLTRLYRAVFALGHDVLRAEGRWLAAVLACGDGAAMSHGAAASALDLRPSSAVVVDVSCTRSLCRQPGLRVHRPRSLAGDVIEHLGIPMTSATRTVIDLAPSLALPALERLVANAEHRGLLDHARLAGARSRKLRAILGGGTPARTRSRHEDRLLAAVAAAGLPKPAANVWLTHGGGEEWEADFLWRRQRVIVEVDDDSHRTRQAFELDRHKDAVRQADGYRTVRFTKRQLREDPARVTALLASLLSTSALM